MPPWPTSSRSTRPPPPLDYYGWELRRQREAHGLRQGQLGDIIFCTGSLIGQIPSGPVVTVGVGAWNAFVDSLR